MHDILLRQYRGACCRDLYRAGGLYPELALKRFILPVLLCCAPAGASVAVAAQGDVVSSGRVFRVDDSGTVVLDPVLEMEWQPPGRSGTTSPSIQPKPGQSPCSRPTRAISCIPTQMPRNGAAPTCTLIPVPRLALDGMLFEIEAEAYAA